MQQEDTRRGIRSHATHDGHMTSPLCFATQQVQAGYTPGTPQFSAVPPIYQTAAYEFSSLADAADLFALRQSGNLYSRNASPTQQVFEERVAALEGGVSAVGVASGQAAVAMTLLALVGVGGHIVAAHQLYGGTVDLLHDTLPEWGITTTFVDQDDIDAWSAAVRPETRAFFAESVANPVAQVLDIQAVADAAHAARVPLVIDNTVGTPYLVRPGEHGADFVVHSATKFMSGHGTSLGGVAVDQGTFDFGADPERWPQFTQAFSRFGNVPLWERFGQGHAFAVLVKSKYVHDLGPSLSPFNAHQILLGLETLDLRVSRQVASAQKIAEFLASHPAVARVNHPGLPDNRWHGLAQKYLPRGVPSVFSFDLIEHDTTTPDASTLRTTEDFNAAFPRVAQVVDNLSVVRLVANIGDARSLIAHPASMTHSHLTLEQRAAAGITPTTIRLSVGIEDVTDIIADLTQALDRPGVTPH